MITPAPNRPEASIESIIKGLEHIGTPIDVIPKKRLPWDFKNTPQLYVFKSGEISIVRASDGLIIATAYEQNIFGISESFQPLRSHFLRAEKSSAILRIDASKAHEEIRKQGLWEDVTSVVSYYNAYLFYRDSLVVQQRIYKIVRSYIIELAALSLEARFSVSILEYVQQRTHLSRSSILKVIHTLIEGGYIEVRRGGYLINIHKIPKEY